MSRNQLLTVALIASLSVNLVFIGVVIGHFVSEPAHRAPHAMQFGWMMRELGRERMAQLRPALEEHARKIRPLQTEVREAQQEFNQLLMAEEIEEEALLGAVLALGNSSTALQQAMHEQMVSTLLKLEPEERRRLAKSLQRRGDRRSGGEPPHRRQGEPDGS